MYDLIYWPEIPGRAEFIRLLLEEAGAPYTDHAQTPAAMPTLLDALAQPGTASNPPVLAPPLLRHDTVVLSQTPSILQYLGQRHNLDGTSGNPAAPHHVLALALTALDGLSNEAHDTHHPIAVGLAYEDQRDASRARAADYTATRLPKFLGYFERVLRAAADKEPWLYGGQLTYADLVLFQCIDGVKYAFPKTLAALESSGDYNAVFKLHAAVKARPNIQKYLQSERRQKYGMGIYRHYPELEQQE